MERADRILFSLMVLLALAGTAELHAQRKSLGKIKDWKILEFHEPDPQRSGTNRLKTLLTGGTAQPQPDETVQIEVMWLGNFERDGRTNLVATAPSARVDMSQRTATSPGPLEILTAQGQLFIQGKGFHCRLTNVVLMISNEVETLIRKELIGRSSTDSPWAGSLAAAAVPAVPGAPTNAPLRISSDQFLFHQPSNVVLYTGRVRVDDPAYGLTCQSLTILLSTNGGIDRIVAEQDVVLLAKASQSRAQGDRAVYQWVGQEELLELTGGPAQWQEGARQGYGERFLYQPRASRIIAPQKSLTRLPRADLIELSFDQPTNRVRKAAASQPTNQFVEVSSQFMAVQLATAQQPGRSLLASNQVLILSPQDQSRATGRWAAYSETNGVLELGGGAEWTSGEKVVRGEAFYFNPTNRTFLVRSNAYLKWPLASLTSTGLLARVLPAGTNRVLGGPFIEVQSHEMEYHAAQLDFLHQVRVFLKQGEGLLGRMTCGHLSLFWVSNEVDRLLARDRVFLEQMPTTSTNTVRTEKSLASEWFSVLMSTNGQVHQMIALTNVLLRQVQYPTNRSDPVKTDLAAGSVTAWFEPHTNDVDRIVAEQNVIIDQVNGRARGQRAVYTRADDSLVLSGDVTLESGSGLLSAPAAVLRHFGLWPGRLGRLTLPGRGSEVRPPKPSAPPSS